MPAAQKNNFKNLQIHSFIGLFPCFPVNVLKDVTKLNSRNFNEEQRLIIFKATNFPTRIHIHRYIELSQNVDWKTMAIMSLKLNNQGFEIFFESGIRMVTIA